MGRGILASSRCVGEQQMVRGGRNDCFGAPPPAPELGVGGNKAAVRPTCQLPGQRQVGGLGMSPSRWSVKVLPPPLPELTLVTFSQAISIDLRGCFLCRSKVMCLL